MTAEYFLKKKEFYLLLYLFIINVYSLSITAIDKHKAKKDKWRIREKNFFITALLGGAAGIMMGMTMFRHKTQHKTFYIGIPLAYIVNLIYILLYIFLVYVKGL